MTAKQLFFWEALSAVSVQTTNSESISLNQFLSQTDILLLKACVKLQLCCVNKASSDRVQSMRCF